MGMLLFCGNAPSKSLGFTLTQARIGGVLVNIQHVTKLSLLVGWKMPMILYMIKLAK
jgi:hypothetical protein